MFSYLISIYRLQVVNELFVRKEPNKSYYWQIFVTPKEFKFNSFLATYTTSHFYVVYKFRMYTRQRKNVLCQQPLPFFCRLFYIFL